MKGGMYLKPSLHEGVHEVVTWKNSDYMSTNRSVAPHKKH